MKDGLITALYCRTALESELDIVTQEIMLKQCAEENNYCNISVYTDNGFSGSNLDRPAMRQLQADVDAGLVGAVLVKDVSRISRNYLDIPVFFDSMNDKGVVVKSVMDNFTFGETNTEADELTQAMQNFYEKTIRALSSDKKPKVAVYARFANEPKQGNELVTALYCRTDQACGLAIANQAATLRQYAKEHGIENIAVYSDNGFNGLNLDRPAMKQLQADVEAGVVGLVIAKDVARISRKHQDFLDFFDEMVDVGVEIKFTSGDFAMGESFMATMKKRREVYQQFLKSKRRTEVV